MQLLTRLLKKGITPAVEGVAPLPYWRLYTYPLMYAAQLLMLLLLGLQEAGGAAQSRNRLYNF